MLHFIDVSKIYQKPNKEDFYALKHFSFNFNKRGLYCILGKSGSGKSTIANLGALLDSPSQGKITYNGQDIAKFKRKQINYYRSKVVTTVFQHYNLLNDLTVLENIIVPRLALQENPKIAKEDALNLLKELGFEDIFANKLCKDLSGGEAQRVAILRAIINNPEVIIADEPTGALDEANSILIMDMLKKISHKKIVIVITHNVKLALQYSDEVVYLADGQLEKVDIRRKREVEPAIKLPPPKHLGKYSKWMYKFALKRFKKNKGKNILSCISMVIGLVSIFLILGFSYGSSNAINNKCLERFDYGTAKISKTETIKLDDSILNLTKMTRLKDNEIDHFQGKYDFINIDINFDSLFSNNIFKVNKKEISGLTISFVYDFSHDYCNYKLLTAGDLPNKNGVIINEPAEKLLKEKTGYPSLIGRDIDLSARYELDNQIDDKVIYDEFKFNHNFKIAAISKEFSFLATPKIYLSYSFIKDKLLMDVVSNYSKEKKAEISWYDYIKMSPDSDDITSFSHKVFAKSHAIGKFNNLIQYFENNDDIDIDSDGYLLKTTFASLMDSVELGLGIFAGLAMVGTILIIGINAFSSYAFEKKNSAIYFAFGVSKQQIFNVFILESIIITSFAYMLSVISAFLLEMIINKIVLKRFDILNIIAIPFKSFHNVPFLLLFAGIIFALMVCITFTYLPLAFSKKINLKKELSDE